MSTKTHRHKWRYGFDSETHELLTKPRPDSTRRFCVEPDCHVVQIKDEGRWRERTALEAVESYAAELEALQGPAWSQFRIDDPETWRELWSAKSRKYDEAFAVLSAEEKNGLPAKPTEPTGGVLSGDGIFWVSRFQSSHKGIVARGDEILAPRLTLREARERFGSDVEPLRGDTFRFNALDRLREQQDGERMHAAMRELRVGYEPDKLAALVAMNVRNAMEQFHAADEDNKIAGLDDEAMAKLNPVVRRAIYEVLDAWMRGLDGDEEANRSIGFLGMGIPGYWETPSELPETGVL
jgi:hypothetical protein